eukprot:359749-Chlamydomonas_euryale.AAC.4
MARGGHVEVYSWPRRALDSSSARPWMPQPAIVAEPPHAELTRQGHPAPIPPAMTASSRKGKRDRETGSRFSLTHSPKGWYAAIVMPQYIGHIKLANELAAQV